MSALTDQPGLQDVAPTSGDFDDDDGGGLVSNMYTLTDITDKVVGTFVGG